MDKMCIQYHWLVPFLAQIRRRDGGIGLGDVDCHWLGLYSHGCLFACAATGLAFTHIAVSSRLIWLGVFVFVFVS
jgi:hypothetical protein